MAVTGIDSAGGLKATTSVGGSSANALATFNPRVQALSPEIFAASKETGVDAKLIASVITAESNGDPQIVCGNHRSCTGAIGAMQLMPGTARQLGVCDPCDKRQNILGGSKYLAMLLKEYGGDVRRAVRAYNAGPGNENKGLAATFKETKGYESKVVGEYMRAGGTGVASVAGLNVNDPRNVAARAPGSAQHPNPGRGFLASFFNQLRSIFVLSEDMTVEQATHEALREEPAEMQDIAEERLQKAILAANINKQRVVNGVVVYPKGTELIIPVLDPQDTNDFKSVAPCKVQLKPADTLATTPPKADPALGRIYLRPTAA